MSPLRTTGRATTIAAACLFVLAACSSSKSARQADSSEPESTTDDHETAPTETQESGESSSNVEVAAPAPRELEEMTRGITGHGELVATIHTTEGVVHCRLFEEKTPITVANFVGLARGKKSWRDPENHEIRRHEPFYDGLPFYRVIPDFIVQAGAPEGDPDLGPGYTLPDEFHPDLTHDRPGMMGMATQGPDTAGSQFYITLRAAPHLDAHHPIFGQCRPLDVLSSIAQRPADANNRPEHPARIEYITFDRREWEPPTSDE